MFSHEIYSNFQELNRWIKNIHHLEIEHFPDPIKPLAEYYVTKRLNILNPPARVDGRKGMPIPYLAYWVSDIFGLKDENIIRELGLSLTYISLVVSVRDDLLDNKMWSEHAHICMANVYYDKYYNTLKRIVDSTSPFWSLLSDCLNEWGKYESWSFLFKHDNQMDPFSDRFLVESSRYLVAITLPTLAAIAFITGKEAKIPKIQKFLRNYWMGWKIMDDFRDWKKDLNTPNYNHSSVLFYALKKVKSLGGELNERSIISIFMNPEFINDIYNSIKEFYLIARQEVVDLEPSYLTRFIDTQLSFQEDERSGTLETKLEFSRAISKLAY